MLGSPGILRNAVLSVWGGEVLGSPDILRNAVLSVYGGYRGLAETQVVGRSDGGDGGVPAFGSVARDAPNIPFCARRPCRRAGRGGASPPQNSLGVCAL